MARHLQAARTVFTTAQRDGEWFAVLTTHCGPQRFVGPFKLQSQVHGWMRAHTNVILAPRAPRT